MRACSYTFLSLYSCLFVDELTAWYFNVLMQFDSFNICWEEAEWFSHERFELFFYIFSDIFLEYFIFLELFLLFSIIEVPVGYIEPCFNFIYGCGILFFSFWRKVSGVCISWGIIIGAGSFLDIIFIGTISFEHLLSMFIWVCCIWDYYGGGTLDWVIRFSFRKIWLYM